MTRTTHINNARHLRNVKHVSSIAMIQSGIDDYLANLKATSHRAANRNTLTPAPKFSPARTSNPEVVDQWEARVQELHAKTRVFIKPVRPTRKYDAQEQAKLLEMAYYFNKYGAPF